MHKLVVAGGTFDLLHQGHKYFLQNILDQSDELILGLTSDEYVLTNKSGNIENYEIRKSNLENFFASIGKKENVEILKIEDIYGNLLDPQVNPDFVAITENIKGSMSLINKKRGELNLSELKFITVPMILAEDGSEISSTRIRNGEIDREGKLYFKREWEGKNFILPENLREELSKPFGKVLQEIPEKLDGNKTIGVGDETIKLLNQKGIDQFLSIIDFKIQRKKIFDSIGDLGFENENLIEVKSLHGTISKALIESIKVCIQSKIQSIILIDGEDDLSVLPCLIFSPLEFTIFYGQPNVGLVQVEVSEKNKNKARGFLNQFLIS